MTRQPLRSWKQPDWEMSVKICMRVLDQLDRTRESNVLQGDSPLCCSSHRLTGRVESDEEVRGGQPLFAPEMTRARVCAPSMEPRPYPRRTSMAGPVRPLHRPGGSNTLQACQVPIGTENGSRQSVSVGARHPTEVPHATCSSQRKVRPRAALRHTHKGRPTFTNC